MPIRSIRIIYKLMGLMDWIKNLFGGGKQEEQAQGQVQEGETSAPEQQDGGQDVSSEIQGETAPKEAEEEHPQQ